MNAYLPIIVSPDGSETLDRLVQSLKADSDSSVRLVGRIIEDSDRQFRKALSPIDRIELGSKICSKSVHELKAEAGRFCNDVDRVTAKRSEHSRNAEAPISSTFDGIITLLSAEQDSNALWSMLVKVDSVVITISPEQHFVDGRVLLSQPRCTTLHSNVTFEYTCSLIKTFTNTLLSPDQQGALMALPNALLPIDMRLSGSDMLVIAMQSRNALSPIVSSDEVSLTNFSDEHDRKARSPIAVTEVGISNAVRAEQKLKTEEFKLSSAVGRSTVDKERQEENAEGPISSILCRTVTESRLEHPVNADSLIDVTFGSVDGM
jgi:hypothetical protein